MPTNPWNDEKTAALKQMVREGYSGGLIAARLGVSRSSVIGKVHRLGMQLGISRNGLGKSSAAKLRKPLVTPFNQRKTPKKIRKVQFEKTDIPQQRAEDIARKSFSELSEHDCRYPVNHVGDPGFGFCALPKMPGSPSYCEHHHRICWVAVPVRKRPAHSEPRETAEVMA
jgi:GcrA cell cycle regulator